MPDVTDLFPLSPFWPIGRALALAQGAAGDGVGEDLRPLEGVRPAGFQSDGACSFADYETLLQFYEAHAVCGCTLHDASYSPAQDWLVIFTDAPDFEESTYDTVVWTCTLRQTTTA